MIFLSTERVSFANQGRATAHALWALEASQRSVYRDLTELVIVVIDVHIFSDRSSFFLNVSVTVTIATQVQGHVRTLVHSHLPVHSFM